MAKLRRKCDQCGKVEDVKYQWGTTDQEGYTEYFCSEECALVCFNGKSVTKCGRCGKTICDENSVYIRANRYSAFGKAYCSAKCFLADCDCIQIEEVNKEKEDGHEVV